MRTRLVLLAVALFVVGLVVGLSAPTTEAQAEADPCAAPWELESSVAAGNNRAAVVTKINRCTGEVYVLANKGEPILQLNDKKDVAWQTYPSK